MTHARLLLLFVLTVAAATAAAYTVPNHGGVGFSNSTEREHHTTVRLNGLTDIKPPGWTVSNTLSVNVKIFPRPPVPTARTQRPRSCNETSKDSKLSPAGAGRPEGDSARAGGGCRVRHAPLTGADRSDLHRAAREDHRKRNTTAHTAPKNQTLCEAGDNRRVCRIAQNQTESEPEIDVSLQKNETDTERVDHIHNVTGVMRNTTREVDGGPDPRLARITEAQHTDDRQRRNTNTSATDHRVHVRVSLGDHPDVVIGASHTTKDTNIKQNRQTHQQKTTDAESRNKHGSSKEQEEQNRLRRTQDTAKVRESGTTFNFTLDKRKLGDADDRPGGDGEMTVTMSAGSMGPSTPLSPIPTHPTPPATHPGQPQPTAATLPAAHHRQPQPPATHPGQPRPPATHPGQPKPQATHPGQPHPTAATPPATHPGQPKPPETHPGQPHPTQPTPSATRHGQPQPTQPKPTAAPNRNSQTGTLLHHKGYESHHNLLLGAGSGGIRANPLQPPVRPTATGPVPGPSVRLPNFGSRPTVRHVSTTTARPFPLRLPPTVHMRTHAYPGPAKLPPRPDLSRPLPSPNVSPWAHRVLHRAPLKSPTIAHRPTPTAQSPTTPTPVSAGLLLPGGHVGHVVNTSLTRHAIKHGLERLRNIGK